MNFVIYRCPKCGNEQCFTEHSSCAVEFTQKPFEILDTQVYGEVTLVHCEECGYEAEQVEFLID